MIFSETEQFNMLKCMDSIDYSQKNVTGSVTMLI